MTAEELIAVIQKEKAKEVTEQGTPPLDSEHTELSSKKRMSLDEPPTMKKVDPLR